MQSDKNILPIGSIVKLKGLNKPFMIFGYLQINGIKEKQIFDYSGVPYPEGNLDVRFNVSFNKENIEEVIFRGFEDESFEPWKNLLMNRNNK